MGVEKRPVKGHQRRTRHGTIEVAPHSRATHVADPPAFVGDIRAYRAHADALAATSPEPEPPDQGPCALCDVEPGAPHAPGCAVTDRYGAGVVVGDEPWDAAATDPSPQVAAGFRDWLNGAAWIDNRGTYRVKDLTRYGYGGKGRRGAPWRKAVKDTYTSTDGLHRDAHVWALARRTRRDVAVWSPTRAEALVVDAARRGDAQRFEGPYGTFDAWRSPTGFVIHTPARDQHGLTGDWLVRYDNGTVTVAGDDVIADLNEPLGPTPHPDHDTDDTPLWGLFDAETGARVSVAAYLSRDAAERAIDTARERHARGGRPDIDPSRFEVRPLD